MSNFEDNTVIGTDIGISIVDTQNTADDTFDFTGETDGESSYHLLTPDGTKCYVPARTIPQESTFPGFENVSGGIGSDTFHFDKGADQDTIADFENNIDTIELDNFGFADAAEALSFATEVGSDVVFDFGGGDMLTVENTNIGALGNDIDIV